jgi:iron(III) transport system substrate-binding protein
MKRTVTALLTLLAAGVPAACGGGDDADLTVYSGRNEKLVGSLIERFERSSGLDVEVRYGDSAELAATIAEEGDNTPADVFFSQDAGSLGATEGQLAPLLQADLRAVTERFRDPTGRWVGTSARARTVAFDKRELSAAELPDSILDFTGSEWKGRIGLPPTNASFQAFVSAMRLEIGDERTREWLDGIKRNDPKLYENNIQTVEAIDRGAVDVGFVNHYYVFELRREQPDLAVENHFLRRGDPGSLVNAAGAGVLEASDDRAAAERFVRFLLSREAQEYFRDETFEYPIAAGVSAPRGLPPLRGLTGPDIRLDDLGRELRPTLDMINEAGLVK